MFVSPDFQTFLQAARSRRGSDAMSGFGRLPRIDARVAV
jgi:hypothetical protein